MYIFYNTAFFMLRYTSIRTSTAKHVKLIDHMNLTCFKNAQITRTSLRISKITSELFQGLRHAPLFFKSRRRKRSIAGYPGIVSSLVVSIRSTFFVPRTHK